MSEKVTVKSLKKQKELVEKLMLVFGEDYNEWLFKQHQQYIDESNEKALDELFRMKQLSLPKKETETEPEVEKNMKDESSTV